MKNILKFLSLLFGAGCLVIACTGTIGNTGDNDDDNGGSEYEELDVKYRKLPLCTDFTAASCGNCPTMATLLEEVDAQRPGKYAMTALHVPYAGQADKYCIPIATVYAEKLNVTGLPVGFIDLRKECEFNAVKSSLDDATAKAMEHPAICGVAIESDYNSADRTLKVTARITSNKHIAFRYLIILTEKIAKGESFVVRDVLSGNVYGEKLNKGIALVPGEEATGMRSKKLDPSWNTANMKIIVAALVSEDEKITWVCDNVAMCGIGENVDYQINK